MGILDSDDLRETRRVLRGQRGVAKGITDLGGALGEVFGGRAGVPGGYHKGHGSWGRSASRDERAWNRLERERSGGGYGGYNRAMREEQYLDNVMNTVTVNATGTLADMYEKQGKGLDDTYVFSSPPRLAQLIDTAREMPEVQSLLKTLGKDADSADRVEVLGAYEMLLESRNKKHVSPAQLMTSLERDVISQSRAAPAAAPEHAAMPAPDTTPKSTAYAHRDQYMADLQAAQNLPVIQEKLGGRKPTIENLEKAWEEALYEANASKLKPGVAIDDEAAHIMLRETVKAYATVPAPTPLSHTPPSHSSVIDSETLPSTEKATQPAHGFSSRSGFYQETPGAYRQDEEEVCRLQSMCNLVAAKKGWDTIAVDGKYGPETSLMVNKLRGGWGMGGGHADEAFLTRLDEQLTKQLYSSRTTGGYDSTEHVASAAEVSEPSSPPPTPPGTKRSEGWHHA